jgi:acetyl esterase/lipase
MKQAYIKPFHSLAQLVEDKQTTRLWEKIATTQHLKATYSERSENKTTHDRVLHHISSPEFVAFEPQQSNGTGILVVPGGSYQRIAIDKEGFEIARVLNLWGYTVFVMSYRLPGDGHSLGANTPLADAQRAVRIIRSSPQYGNLRHIGVLGFSAGGHIAARLATQFAAKIYPGTDSIDKSSAYVDFAALLYPVISMKPGIAHTGSLQELIGTNASDEDRRMYSAEQYVSSQTPPCFITHAIDDTSVIIENSLSFFQALKSHSVLTEIHLYQEGGHGFAAQTNKSLPVHIWPNLLHKWLSYILNNQKDITTSFI